MTSSPGPADDAVARLRAALEEIARALSTPGGLDAPARAPSAASGPLGTDDAALLSAVEDVVRIPVAGLEVAEVTALAVDRAARLLHADRVMVLLADRPAGPLVARSALGFRRDDLEHVTVDPGEGLLGEVFRTGRVVAIHGGGAGPDRDPFVDRFPVTEAIAVPVRGDDGVVGVLFAGRRGPVGFDVRDTLVLTLIADRVGAALGVLGVLDRRRGNLGRLAGLREVAAEIAAGRDLRAIVARAAEAGPALLGLPVAFVALSADGEALTVVAAHGLPGSRLLREGVRPDKGPVGEALVTGEPRAVRDVASLPEAVAGPLLDAGLRACLFLPLVPADQAAGVLCLADIAPRDFSPEDVAVGGVLASLVGLAIANHRTVGDLRAALLRMGSAQERLVQVERARALGGMAAGLARELSQVFALIVGKSQWLLGRAQDDTAREALGALEEAAWQGADIVRRLEGLGETAPEDSAPTDARAAAQEAIAQLRAHVVDEGDQAALRVDLASELEPTPAVAVPAAALREAALSLLLNALDAMPAGGRLTVTTRERDGGAELVVADTGEGIAEDVRPRIFDPFFTTRATQRLGLGLTVVHGLVSRYAGRIDVASRVGVGTIVTVWLPPSGKRVAPAPPAIAPSPPRGLTSDNGHPSSPAAPAPVPAAAGAPAPVASAAVAAAPPGRPAPAGSAAGPGAITGREAATAPGPAEATAVLVLEAEEASRASLVDALRGAGYRVVSAADGPAGLALFGAVRFDLVLTDLALPRLSGLAVARSVKRASPGTAVVLMTGWGHLLDPERLREQGVDLLLVKPFRSDRLLAVVEEALRLRPLA